AGEREPGRRMVRRLRGGVVLLVARDAIERGRLEVAALVARHAIERAVRGVERHPGVGRVIALDVLPAGRLVALAALRAETRLKAIVLAAHPVAVEARAGRPLELLFQVARRARHRGVLAFELE